MTQILYVAFSHTLTQDQISDAKESLGIESIITLSEDKEYLHKKMVAIPAQLPTWQVRVLAEDIVWRAIEAGASHFYIAGEPTLCYYAITEAIKSGLKVVQSTTERVSVESIQPDGSVLKTATFKHVQWRVLI